MDLVAIFLTKSNKIVLKSRKITFFIEEVQDIAAVAIYLISQLALKKYFMLVTQRSRYLRVSSLNFQILS